MLADRRHCGERGRRAGQQGRVEVVIERRHAARGRLQEQLGQAQAPPEALSSLLLRIANP